MAGAKERLDKLMVERGIVPTREQARGMIMAGDVVVNDHVVSKAGHAVDADSEIRLKREPMPYVSRGGLKLATALDEFDIDVKGVVAIDVGASTGGFTDCLLQRGARIVYSVDVGYGQLAWKLRQDERVVNLEKTNIRHLAVDRLTERPQLAVIDASFISLEKVLPPTIGLLGAEARIVALIKPQFEVGRGGVGKGGIVRDSAQHDAVIESVRRVAETLGLQVHGVIESPLLGAKGNREFLIYMEKGM
jgi:23S rRNA (cytidine1920-2'-O)/16S rRNA (cytidine1409-2'-O)-methyltransferase